MSNHRANARIRAALTAGLCFALTPACGQKRTTPPPVEPELAASLGLGEDALDPSQRDKMAGYDRWKPKPEPDGTASPLSPTRRRIARPAGLD